IFFTNCGSGCGFFRCGEQQRARSQAKRSNAKPKRPATAPAPASAPATQPPASSATDEQLQKALAELQKEHERNVQVIKKLYEEKTQAEKRAAYLHRELAKQRAGNTISNSTRNKVSACLWVAAA